MIDQKKQISVMKRNLAKASDSKKQKSLEPEKLKSISYLSDMSRQDLFKYYAYLSGGLDVNIIKQEMLEQAFQMAFENIGFDPRNPPKMDLDDVKSSVSPVKKEMEDIKERLEIIQRIQKRRQTVYLAEDLLNEEDDDKRKKTKKQTSGSKNIQLIQQLRNKMKNKKEEIYRMEDFSICDVSQLQEESKSFNKTLDCSGVSIPEDSMILEKPELEKIPTDINDLEVEEFYLQNRLVELEKITEEKQENQESDSEMDSSDLRELQNYSEMLKIRKEIQKEKEEQKEKNQLEKQKIQETLNAIQQQKEAFYLHQKQHPELMQDLEEDQLKELDQSDNQNEDFIQYEQNLVKQLMEHAFIKPIIKFQLQNKKEQAEIQMKEEEKTRGNTPKNASDEENQESIKYEIDKSKQKGKRQSKQITKVKDSNIYASVPTEHLSDDEAKPEQILHTKQEKLPKLFWPQRNKNPIMRVKGLKANKNEEQMNQDEEIDFLSFKQKQSQYPSNQDFKLTIDNDQSQNQAFHEIQTQENVESFEILIDQEQEQLMDPDLNLKIWKQQQKQVEPQEKSQEKQVQIVQKQKQNQKLSMNQIFQKCKQKMQDQIQEKEEENNTSESEKEKEMFDQKKKILPLLERKKNFLKQKQKGNKKKEDKKQQQEKDNQEESKQAQKLPPYIMNLLNKDPLKKEQQEQQKKEKSKFWQLQSQMEQTKLKMEKDFMRQSLKIKKQEDFEEDSDLLTGFQAPSEKFKDIDQDFDISEYKQSQIPNIQKFQFRTQSSLNPNRFNQMEQGMEKITEETVEDSFTDDNYFQDDLYLKNLKNQLKNIQQQIQIYGTDNDENIDISSLSPQQKLEYQIIQSLRERVGLVEKQIIDYSLSKNKKNLEEITISEENEEDLVQNEKKLEIRVQRRLREFEKNNREEEVMLVQMQEQLDCVQQQLQAIGELKVQQEDQLEKIISEKLQILQVANDFDLEDQLQEEMFNQEDSIDMKAIEQIDDHQEEEMLYELQKQMMQAETDLQNLEQLKIPQSEQSSLFEDQELSNNQQQSSISFEKQSITYQNIQDNELVLQDLEDQQEMEQQFCKSIENKIQNLENEFQQMNPQLTSSQQENQVFIQDIEKPEATDINEVLNKSFVDSQQSQENQKVEQKFDFQLQEIEQIEQKIEQEFLDFQNFDLNIQSDQKDEDQLKELLNFKQIHQESQNEDKEQTQPQKSQEESNQTSQILQDVQLLIQKQQPQLENQNIYKQSIQQKQGQFKPKEQENSNKGKEIYQSQGFDFLNYSLGKQNQSNIGNIQSDLLQIISSSEQIDEQEKLHQQELLEIEQQENQIFQMISIEKEKVQESSQNIPSQQDQESQVIKQIQEMLSNQNQEKEETSSLNLQGTGGKLDQKVIQSEEQEEQFQKLNLSVENPLDDFDFKIENLEMSLEIEIPYDLKKNQEQNESQLKEEKTSNENQSLEDQEENLILEIKKQIQEGQKQ